MKYVLCVAFAAIVGLASTACKPAQAPTPPPTQPPVETPAPPATPPAAAPAAAPAPEAAPTADASDDDDFFFEQADDAPAPAKLSEFNAFSDVAKQIPADDVVPYGLNTAHFSDYARVVQFVRVPAGKQAAYAADGVFEFPAGAVFFQTFSYPQDARDPASPERRVETRVLRRLAGGWDAIAYQWNKEGTDARRSIAGGIVPVTWTDAAGAEQSLKYVIMNKNDCKRCHENQGVTLAIGATAANLNRDFGYPGGAENQLVHWAKRGILAGAPDAPGSAPRLARWDHPEDGDAEVRARAWLHVNCAHCHNPLGAGAVSGLDLRIAEESPIRLGIFKPPVAAGRGSEGLRYSVEPGKPKDSFMIGRLTSTDPSVMMPPVGRRVPDAEAIALVSEWISGMQFDETEAQKLIAKQRELLEYVKREGKWPEEMTK